MKYCALTEVLWLSQWPHNLMRGSAVARLFWLRVWIPLGSWMFVSCECCVLSGRGLCVGPITRTEESYRVRCVWVWSWSPVRGDHDPTSGRNKTERQIVFENSVLSRKLGPRRVAVQNCAENCIVRRFVLWIMALWWLILGAEFCHMFLVGGENCTKCW
jgi:hypothetical protein